VELPSGKALAQTQWRLHDRGQYLWELGHGRFLLRVRDRLSVIVPMQAGDAFREVPVLRIDRHLVALQVSPDEDLLTVESMKFASGDPGVASDVTLVDPTLQHPAQPDPAPVQINFYRLASTGAGAEGLVVASAGAISAHTAVELPMTTTGFLDVIEGGKDRWLFNFDEHTGKVNELAEFDTTCFPRPTFISQSEFVAFGCRGGTARQALAGFNLKGEEMWQQSFNDTNVAPTFSFAPGAGRFALGRIVVSGAFSPDTPLTGSTAITQEVRVIQSYDGKLLFRTDCTPVERAGQNFALSADGMRLAVVREAVVHHDATKDYDEYTERQAAVEVYAMPPLTEKDQAAVKAAEAMTPRDAGARIDLSLERISKAPVVEAVTAPDAASGASAVRSAQARAETGAPAAVEGDAQPAAPRKPPTLYGPDEKPSGQTPQQGRE